LINLIFLIEVAKHTFEKTCTCILHTLVKETKKLSINGESLNQAHCSCCEKKRQQTYNIIFIWVKIPNLKPKPNSKPTLKPFSILPINLINFDHRIFQLNNKGPYPWFGD
jgi:hypothetical protein